MGFQLETLLQWSITEYGGCFGVFCFVFFLNHKSISTLGDKPLNMVSLCVLQRALQSTEHTPVAEDQQRTEAVHVELLLVLYGHAL